jgi:hypothetical protein
MEIKNGFSNNKKNYFVLKIKKKLLYIKIIFLGWVIGTPLHFGGMTVRGQAVILKFNVLKSCDPKKSVFLLGHSVRNSNVHPVYVSSTGTYQCQWTSQYSIVNINELVMIVR